MTRNYFWLIHITIEKIIIGSTQLTHDVLGTSPEGPLKVLTSGTYRGPFRGISEDSSKFDDFIEKLLFRSNSPCITYLFLFFTEEKMFKRSKRGRPWDVYRTQLRDVHGTKWWDVLGTSMGRRSKICFLDSTHKHIKLNLTGYSRHYHCTKNEVFH